MREEGYYWVKMGGDWQIARWSSPYTDGTEPEWSVIAWLIPFNDSDFEEIDERRITRDVPYYVYQECPDPQCCYAGECQQSFIVNGKCKMPNESAQIPRQP
jgi:hypothetical protein